MRSGVCRPRVGGILREGALDLRTSGGMLTVLRQRHAVMRGKPPVVRAVMWCKLVQQGEQHALLSGATGRADEAIGKSGGGEDQHVARPGIEMHGKRGDGGLGVASNKVGEEGDMAGFAIGEVAGARLGCSDGGTGGRSVTA